MRATTYTCCPAGCAWCIYNYVNESCIGCWKMHWRVHGVYCFHALQQYPVSIRKLFFFLLKAKAFWSQAVGRGPQSILQPKKLHVLCRTKHGWQQFCSSLYTDGKQSLVKWEPRQTWQCSWLAQCSLLQNCNGQYIIHLAVDTSPRTKWASTNWFFFSIVTC